MMKISWKRVGVSFAIGQTFLLLVPVLLSLLRIPDTLTLDVDSKQEFSVQIGYKRLDGSVRQYTTCPQELGAKPIYLPVVDRNRSNLAFGICSGHGNFALKSVVLRKWCVFPLELDVHSLMNDYKTTKGMTLKLNESGRVNLVVNEDSYFIPVEGCHPAWKCAFFKDMRLLAGFIGFELLLLFVSVLCALRKEADYGLKMNVLQSGMLSLSMAAFFCLILPTQSYLVNRVSFPYAYSNLLPELLCGFICTLLALWVLFMVFQRAFGGMVYTVAFGFLLYCYLATGIMAAGLPSLDGDFRYFSADKVRQMIDLGVLAFCVSGFALATKWVRPFVHWCALAILVMSVASLFDVRVEQGAVQEKKYATELCSVEDIAKSGFWSSNGNVIVLVPDSVSTELAEGVFGEDAAIRNEFRGFTFYTNNIGMHNITPLGLPGLITGEYLDDLRNLKKHQAAVAGAKSCLAPYAEADNPVFALMDLNPNFRWTNRLVREATDREEKALMVDSPLYRRINDLQAWNLFEIVRFRLTPFCFKYQMAFLTMKDWPMFDRGSSEMRLYPILANFPVKDDKMALHIYHTEGCHFPFQIGKHGEKLAEPLQDYEGMYNKTYFVFENLVKLFKTLKQNGVYDNSLIVVCADHGANHTRRTVHKVNGITYEASKPFPVLLVKPVGAHGDLQCSGMSTSHTRIAPLVVKSCNGIVCEDDIRRTLNATNRMYIDFNPHDFTKYKYWFSDDSTRLKDAKTIDCK